MRELVVVVSDLYLSPETPEPQLPEGTTLPGLQQITRYAKRARLSGDWRTWVAQWFARGASLGGQDGSGTDRERSVAGTHAVPTTAAVAARALPRLSLPAGSTVWMATPVHLVAGLSSVHLDRRSILRLSAEELGILSQEFRRTFHDSGFELAPLESGEFLLFGPQISTRQELEPARLLGRDVTQARQGALTSPLLRRLTTEIEMWLHEHRLNDARARRGESLVTALWLWGGGDVLVANPMAVRSVETDIAFGRDAYLSGLLASCGQKVLPSPPQLTDIFSYARAQRAVLVIEIGSMLQSNPAWSFLDALSHLDQAFLQPAMQMLRAAKLDRVQVLANDRLWALHARDRFKIWRRAPLGLSGLR